MDVIIEHSFCLYCDEATEIYFRIMNTILFSDNEHLKEETQLEEYFTFGYGAHHIWISQRRPSDKNKLFKHRVMMARF